MYEFLKKIENLLHQKSNFFNYKKFSKEAVLRTRNFLFSKSKLGRLIYINKKIRKVLHHAIFVRLFKQMENEIMLPKRKYYRRGIPLIMHDS